MEHRAAGSIEWVAAPAENFTGNVRFGPLSQDGTLNALGVSFEPGARTDWHWHPDGQVLYVTEGTYLDWGTRLIEESKRPDNPIYREWIGLHGPDVLGDLVAWMSDHLDHADPKSRQVRIETLFVTALRYEYMFWEAAYHGEKWMA